MTGNRIVTPNSVYYANLLHAALVLIRIPSHSCPAESPGAQTDARKTHPIIFCRPRDMSWPEADPPLLLLLLSTGMHIIITVNPILPLITAVTALEIAQSTHTDHVVARRGMFRFRSATEEEEPISIITLASAFFFCCASVIANTSIERKLGERNAVEQH